jgi:uncharacterized protein (DUF3820 family)
MLKKYRIPNRKCKGLKNHFLHLGEYRGRFLTEVSKHGYTKIHQEAFEEFGENVLIPLPEEYKRYVPKQN